MERLQLRYQDAVKSLGTLKAIVPEPFSQIIRDATIQRFEYTFEAFWKCLKEYLREKEGVIAASPKSVFRELFSAGVLSEQETVACLEMTDRRNDTVHTYQEKVAQMIYQQTPSFAGLMDGILQKLKDKILCF